MAENLQWRFWDETAERWRTHDFWREALAWHGTATPHVLPRVATFGLISALICAVAGPRLAIPVGPHEVAGAVLGLLLVLRTNAGYERWWEARRLWGGIVNQARNLAIQALAYGPGAPPWRDQVVRLTIAFAHVARHSLRGEREIPDVAALLGAGPAARIARAAHMPNAVAREIGRSLRQAHEGEAMDGFAFMQAEGQRATLIDHVGACERILKTPLARVYSIKIRQFIVLFLVTLNFALLDRLKSNWLVPPVLMLVAYPVLAVDLIGSELQNPFSRRNLGHLPLEDICGTIEANLLGLVAEEAEAEGEAGTSGLDRETGDGVG
ncbi:bestrophin family ion channel [Singulisphaera sp. Ch08]|uniref:Bestrophin family ion channel n=1 Tax=Singulisphaera sp. Ch08 TaxID=3120278 RepID=A0AAU7CEK3_9BACT